MKSKFLFIALSALLLSCGNSEKKVVDNASSDEVPACCRNKSMEVLFPSEVSAKGSSLFGKEVAVRGFVKKVCHCSGKKCHLADNDEAEISLMVMANAEIGKFSQELTGKSVKYVGVVRENRITKEMIAASEAKQKEAAESEQKSCCSAKKEESENEHKHCSKSKDYSEMKKWMEDNQADYYPVYYVEANNFEVME